MIYACIVAHHISVWSFKWEFVRWWSFTCLFAFLRVYLYVPSYSSHRLSTYVYMSVSLDFSGCQIIEKFRQRLFARFVRCLSITLSLSRCFFPLCLWNFLYLSIILHRIVRGNFAYSLSRFCPSIFLCVYGCPRICVFLVFFCVFVCLSVSIGMSDCVCISMSVSTSFMDHLKTVLHRKNLPLIPLQVFNQLAIIVSVEDFSSYYLINICL